MSPELSLLLLWVAFGGTHMVLSSLTVRPKIVGALGLNGFLGLYSLVALATFVPLVSVYLGNRHGGELLWSLRDMAGVRAASMWISGACFSISIASFFQPSPAMFGVRAEPRAYGLLRITRHPLFAPIAVLGLSHLLLNAFVTDVIFFGGLLVYGVVGCMHQDARKRASEGAPFEAFLAETSLIPFVAILSGRTKLVWSELPWLGLAVGVVAAVGFYHLHWTMFF
jgi:uncharacterized membrane protein